MPVGIRRRLVIPAARDSMRCAVLVLPRRLPEQIYVCFPIKSVSACVGVICGLATSQFFGQSGGVSPASTSGVVDERFSRQVDALFATLAEGARPGAVVLIARAGKIVHLKAYGMANIGRR